jgi:outer membrane protein OmpA-like peptidoglycan-associated protein
VSNHSLPASVRTALVLLALPVAAAGQQVSGRVSDIQSKVTDLAFRVEDMGGKVQTLDVKETPTEIRIDLAADVLFDFDKSDILPKAQQTLAQAAQVIRDKATGTVRIEGYTDAKGSESYNQGLSERRANAVKTWLVAKGSIGGATLSTKGFGSRNAVAPNVKPDGSDDPDGRQKNRRVEIIIEK